MTDNSASPKAVEVERRLRRYPWLTREDMVILNALPFAAAREFERLLRYQAKADADFRRRCLSESEIGEGAVEAIHSARRARAEHGTGGGRVRGHDLRPT